MKQGSSRSTPGFRARRSHGFSLIELLVAVLVMGIGVLGVTALQLVSMQNNRAALMRADAVQLAHDMMDRIRANPAGSPAGAAYDGLAMGDAPPNPPSGYCVSGPCSTDQMVALDQAMWKCMLGSYVDDDVCSNMYDEGLLPANAGGDGQQAGLPSGDGSVSVDGSGLVEVTVQWKDADGAVQNVTIDSR
ncbi:MAG: type IV pilus modification protein PilV [Pseudomonadota bacterium]